MGFLLSEKTYFQNPYLCRTEDWLTGQVGRPDRSTAPWSVDRPSRPTCTALCTLSAQWPVDRDGRPLERAVLSGFIGRPGRSTGGSNGRILTVGGRPARSTGSTDRSQRLVFSGLYKRGFCHCLKLRF